MRRCIELATSTTGAPAAARRRRATSARSRSSTGDIPARCGYFEDAEQAFREIAPGLVPRTQIDQARALLAAGLAEEAARHLDEALPELREQRISQDLAEAEVARAAAALLEGDLTLAKQLAGSAHRRFVKRGSAAVGRGRRADQAAGRGVAALADPADGAVAGQGRPSSPSGCWRSGSPTRPRWRPCSPSGSRCAAAAIDTAEALLEQVPPLRKIAPIDHKMLLRLCRAEVALARGQSRRALAQARAGLTELGAARDRMGGLDLVCGTAVHGLELGRLAVTLVLDGARTEADARRLLAWQERTRAQVYRYEPMPAIDDPELASRVAELRTVLRTVQQARLERRPVAQLERRSTALQREVSRLGWHTSHWGRPRPVSLAGGGHRAARRPRADQLRRVRTATSPRWSWRRADEAGPARRQGGRAGGRAAAARRPGRARAGRADRAARRRRVAVGAAPDRGARRACCSARTASRPSCSATASWSWCRSAACTRCRGSRCRRCAGARCRWRRRRPRG